MITNENSMDSLIASGIAESRGLGSHSILSSRYSAFIAPTSHLNRGPALVPGSPSKLQMEMHWELHETKRHRVIFYPLQSQSVLVIRGLIQAIHQPILLIRGITFMFYELLLYHNAFGLQQCTTMSFPRSSSS